MGAPVLFAMLAEPSRFRMVEELHGGERSVGELVAAVGLCQPGVSRHLRILHDAGLVEVRAVGRRRLYSLRREPFRDAARWVQDFQELLHGKLDRLDALVEAESRAPRARPSKGPRGRRKG